MRLLRKCDCGYTIDQTKKICEKCNSPFRSAYPPKFSLHDKYASYRRKMKEIARMKGSL
ncbi:MAG: nucleolar RNA-binding Nop10p family protein [Candidatus Hodarchaeales archaeon]